MLANWMRNGIGPFLALLLTASSAQGAGTSVVVSFTGPNFPDQSEGWFLGVNGDPIEALLHITPTAIPDDMGFPVFAVNDRTALAGVYFRNQLLPQERANALAAGFVLRARLRVLPEAAPIDPQDGLAAIEFGLFGDDYLIQIGANAGLPAGNGNMRILAVGASPELEIAGGAVYHLIELVYDPITETADLFVDGVERVSDWPLPAFPNLDVAAFGSADQLAIGAMGELRTHLFEIEINLPDCDDGLDNDADGLSDLDDPGCLALEDTSELDSFVCNDGTDNDADGLVDLADPGCTSPIDELEVNVGPGAASWLADLSLVIEPDFGDGIPPVQIDGSGVVALQTVYGVGRLLAVPSLAGTVTGTGGPSFEAVSVSAALSADTVVLTTSGPSNTMPMRGEARLCIIDTSCDFFFGLPFSGPRFATMGVGGEWTIDTGTIPARVTYLYGPWTLGTASLLVKTTAGSTTIPTRMGFVHGPLSASSTLSATSGVVQLVTPMRVELIGGIGLEKGGLFATLQVRLVPEPARALLLAAGAAAVLLLGWRRR